MSFPTTNQGSPLSLHLRAIKKILQDVVFDAKVATSLKKVEVDALERDVFELLCLARFWRNRFAPISRIPPEILALVPDFLDPNYRDQGIITLTHVCRTWREVFASRSSLWADFDCEDGDKTDVYLERSKSSPISLSLYRSKNISPRDPFFRVIPHTIGRLRSLSVRTTPKNIQAITPHLSYPAPLLEHLTIDGDCEVSGSQSTLPSALFDRNLSSLHTLHLDTVITELPWRNMVNLTSFTLAYTLLEETSVGQLLDFFEAAPHLREVTLRYATPTTGAQNGRLVSLACLKSMYIEDCAPSSVLLDHLVIPVGAKLKIQTGLVRSLVGEHLPRSLDNLENFSNFTTIQLHLEEEYPYMEFSGPNGEVTTIPTISQADRTGLTLGLLAHLNTSKAKRLEIYGGNPLYRNPIYQALLPMTNLRTLALSESTNSNAFVCVLHPGIDTSEVVVCPELEELCFDRDADKLDTTSVIEMAAARASRGVKLRTIKIVGGQSKVHLDVMELRKHVRNVEYSP